MAAPHRYTTAAELARELTVDIDWLLARAGQVVSGMAVVASVGLVFSLSAATGAALLMLSLAMVTFYTAQVVLLSARSDGGRDRAWNPPEAIRWLSPMVEALLPAGVLWILAATGDPEYALGSWAPPQLFAGLIVGSVVRADPRVPAVMGVVGAAAYLAVYLLGIAPALSDRILLFSPQVHLARTLSLLGMGGAASLLAWWLRSLGAEAAARIDEPSMFGNYRLGAEIASGGMGRVFDAVLSPDGVFERRVALKLMHPHLASDEAYVARFRNEAAITSRLAHPNVVGAVDFGTVDRTWFLALDFVEGRALSDVLAEHRRVGRSPAPRVVLGIAQQVAAALLYAHEHARDADGQTMRVVHRDLSPSNILLDRTGRVRIVDFGVARALHDEPQASTALLAGKPSYVAPEALREGVIDPRVDLWSLGVILWEALANQRLFARESEAASMLAVIEAELVPPSTFHPFLHSQWDRLVGRLLARNPDDRYPSAGPLLEDLDALARIEGPMLGADLSELMAVEEGLEELPIEFTADEGHNAEPG